VLGRRHPNKAALERYYEKFLSKELNRCTTCHLPSDIKDPESLEDFPHNPFGNRLRALGEEWAKEGKRKDIATRLATVGREDADCDGIDNEVGIASRFQSRRRQEHADDRTNGEIKGTGR
jgi:hypothetical protein